VAELGPVLLVSGEYPPDIGGLADYTRCLRRALAARGVDTRVLTRRRVAPVEPGVLRVVRRWDARALSWLVRVCPPRGIVHLQYQAAGFDLLGDVCLAPLLLRRLRPRTRWITTFHDARPPYLFPRAGRLRPLAPRLLARLSAAVLASDERDLRTLRVGADRGRVVPIGPNVECRPPADYDRRAFRASLGLEPDQIAIAYFGLLNASKGLDTLIAAFRRLLAGVPTARLLVLGGPVGASDPTDRATAARTNLALDDLGASVLRTGHLPPDALSAHLLAADLALLPYTDGASPRRGSLLACAAHGLPIVTTLPTSGGLDEVVVARTAGDAAGLAEAALQVTADPLLRARLSQASRGLAERTSWRGIAEQHLSVYAALTAG
jgi:glycosyltransferase involved in cell wall biosynthesis